MYQQLILIGNLGSDPEMRYTPGGVTVASFRMATSRSWTGADGQKQEKVNWWRVSVWNKQAETVSQYLHKGSKVLVIGTVEEARAYVDKTGNPAASIEIRADSVRFLDSKGEKEDPTDSISVKQAQDIPF